MSTALTTIKVLGLQGEGDAAGDTAAADTAAVRETPASAPTSPASAPMSPASAPTSPFPHVLYLSPSPPVSGGAARGGDDVGGEGLVPRAARVPVTRPASVWTVGTRVLEFLEIASDSPCSSAGGLTPVGLNPVCLTPVVRTHLTGVKPHLAARDPETRHTCPEKAVKAPPLLCHGPLRPGNHSRHGSCHGPPRQCHQHAQLPPLPAPCDFLTVGMGWVWDCHARSWAFAM